MPLELQFGRQALSLTIPKAKLVGSFHGPVRRAESNGIAELRRCLNEPVGAPPLARAVVPRDHIAVVVDRGLPGAAALLEPVLESLTSAGVLAGDVSIVFTPGDRRLVIDDLGSEFVSRWPDVAVLQHDPEDQESLAYLASTGDGRRVYLNRRVAEADAMILMGRAGFDMLVGMRGTASDLFPAMSDPPAQRDARIRAMVDRDRSGTLRGRQACDEVAWLAGCFYALVVNLDRDNQVEAVWFGEFKTVQERAEKHVRNHWQLRRPGKMPDLVIVCVSRTPEPADWDSVSAAAELATQFVAEEGAILILSDLADPPGEAIRRLAEQDNPWETLNELRESQAADSLSAALLAGALSRCHVHLHSRLDLELVESLGMTPVSTVGEIEHLVAKHSSVYLVEDADRAWIAKRND